MEGVNQIKSKVILYGGTGQSKVLRPMIERLGSRVDLVIDDTPDLAPPFSDVPLVCGMGGFHDWFKGRFASEYTFIVAIGNPYGRTRMKLSFEFEALGFELGSVADSTAIIEENVCLGKGCQILPGAILCSESSLGDCVIVNTGAQVDHECCLGNGVEIAPGAVLCGNVNLADYVWIGAGATVLPRIAVGEDSIVGAGAVVTKDVGAKKCVMGVPAKYVREV